jgi:apolipoprotein N-acyltransferase
MIGSLKEFEENRKKNGYEKPQLTTHPFFHSLYFRIFGSVLSGVILALAFPGFGYSTLAFVALVPLLFAVQSVSAKRAAGLGLLSGCVFFMISLSWLGNLTGMVEGWGLKASTWAGCAFLAFYCGLYFVPFSMAVPLFSRVWLGDDLRKNVRLMFVLTMLWVGAEYARSILLTGFPWNLVGVSQYNSPAIIQCATWGGVYAVSALVVWMNIALFVTFRQYTHGTRTRKYRPHLELMIGLAPLALSLAGGMKVLLNKPLCRETVNVALVQPNISQTIKWDDAKDVEIRQTLKDLTIAVTRLNETDLVIWPETAVPDLINNPATPHSQNLVQYLVAQGIPLLVGAMDYDFEGDRVNYHNSSILYGPDGAAIGKYHKQHLVPFGEYVPFPKLMRKFTPVSYDVSAGNESTLLSLPGTAPFSPLICFEDTVAPLAAKAVRAGARWLVNQTNDAWFDPSCQSEQHLAHAVFRCVENRVPMARSCNTGVSCFIDAFGIISHEARPETKLDVRSEGFAVGSLFPRAEDLPQTFYTRHGDRFAQTALVVGALSVVTLRVRGRRAAKASEQDA